MFRACLFLFIFLRCPFSPGSSTLVVNMGEGRIVGDPLSISQNF